MRPARLASVLALFLIAAGAWIVAGCEREAERVMTVTVTVGGDATESAGKRDLRDMTRLVEGPLQPSKSGHLAYVASDGNVYVVDPSTAATVRVTRDRSSAGTGFGIFHSGLAWSSAGELAFARSNIDTFTSALSRTVPGTGKVTRVTPEIGMLIYASWSPASCDGSGCTELAYIADVDGEPGGKVALQVLDVPARSPSRSILEQRADQIYFAWTKDRGTLVRHVLGRRSRLEEVDIAAGTATRIGGRLAPFLAPAVTSGRVVYPVAGAAAEPSVTVTDSAVVVHVPGDSRRVAFAPSPDGRRLAFAVRHRPELTPPQAFEEPWIADLETGEIVRVGPTLWTEAFYWSPDGKRLAYLTWLDNNYRRFNQWRIFDAVTQRDTGSVSFEPTSTFDTLTTFFDQFGQSHSFWSPDGRYLAYAAVAPDGRDQVWLLDTLGDAEPVLVADGVVAVFSRN